MQFDRVRNSNAFSNEANAIMKALVYVSVTVALMAVSGVVGFFLAGRNLDTLMTLGAVADAKWHITFLDRLRSHEVGEAIQYHEWLLARELEAIEAEKQKNPALTGDELLKELEETLAAYNAKFPSAPIGNAGNRSLKEQE